MNQPKIKLLGYRLLVELETDRPKGMLTAPGHIELPEQIERDKTIGTVVSLGDGRYNNQGDRATFDVKIGDRVKLGPYATFEYFEDDREFRIVAGEDVIGVL